MSERYLLSKDKQKFDDPMSKSFLYKALTSGRPIMKEFAESIYNIKKKISGTEVAQKKKFEIEEKHKKELFKFLNNTDTIEKLININIDPKQFNVNIISKYPLKSQFLQLQDSFKKLIDQANGKKINPKRLENIIERMMSTTREFKLKDDDFLNKMSRSRSSSDIKRRSRSRSRSKRLSSDSIKSRSTIKSNEDLSSSFEELPKLKTNTKMRIQSLPNIAELSPFSFTPNKLQQKGTSIKRLVKKTKRSVSKKRSVKKRSIKKRSVSKKVTKKRSVKKRSVTKKRSVKKRSVSKKVTKKRSIKKRSIKKVTKKRSIKKVTKNKMQVLK